MELYSEKLEQLVSISEETVQEQIVMEDNSDTLVGWVHNGWNNDNGTVW